MVACKHFVGQRQAFRADHQPNANLLAVRAIVAAVTARRFAVAQRLALEKRAGHVVEQKLQPHPKPTLVAFEQVLRELFLCACSASKPLYSRSSLIFS